MVLASKILLAHSFDEDEQSATEITWIGFDYVNRKRVVARWNGPQLAFPKYLSLAE
jgi:hypothetical protein